MLSSLHVVSSLKITASFLKSFKWQHPLIFEVNATHTHDVSGAPKMEHHVLKVLAASKKVSIASLVLPNIRLGP